MVSETKNAVRTAIGLVIAIDDAASQRFSRPSADNWPGTARLGGIGLTTAQFQLSENGIQIEFKEVRSFIVGGQFAPVAGTVTCQNETALIDEAISFLEGQTSPLIISWQDDRFETAFLNYRAFSTGVALELPLNSRGVDEGDLRCANRIDLCRYLFSDEFTVSLEEALACAGEIRLDRYGGAERLEILSILLFALMIRGLCFKRRTSFKEFDAHWKSLFKWVKSLSREKAHLEAHFSKYDNFSQSELVP